jgi:hypothetical protein
VHVHVGTLWACCGMEGELKEDGDASKLGRLARGGEPLALGEGSLVPKSSARRGRAAQGSWDMGELAGRSGCQPSSIGLGLQGGTPRARQPLRAGRAMSADTNASASSGGCSAPSALAQGVGCAGLLTGGVRLSQPTFMSNTCWPHG